MLLNTEHLLTKLTCGHPKPTTYRNHGSDYWMGYSLFLTISARDHTLAKEGFNSFTGGKKTLKLSSK